MMKGYRYRGNRNQEPSDRGETDQATSDRGGENKNQLVSSAQKQQIAQS